MSANNADYKSGLFRDLSTSSNMNTNNNYIPPPYTHANALTQSTNAPIYTMSYLHLSSLRDSIEAEPAPLYPPLPQSSPSTAPPPYTHPAAPQPPGQYYTVTTHYQPPPPRPDLPPLYSHALQSTGPSALNTQYAQYLAHYQHGQALWHTQSLDEHVRALQREAKFRKFQQEQIAEMRRIELAHEARKRQGSADTQHARAQAKELAIRGTETQQSDFKREAQQLIEAYHKCDTKSTPLWQLTAFTVTAAEDRLASLYSSRGHFDANHPSLHSDWLVLSDDESRIVTLPQDDNAGLAQSIRVMEDNKNAQFAAALQAHTTVARLRALALAVGVPHQHRAEIWARLLGVVGPDPAQWHAQLTQRRDEYVALLHSLSAALSPESVVQLQMIAVDVPRTHPQGWGLLFSDPVMQHSLQRVLLVWSVNHPHVAYYQGLNDLAVPLYIVYMTACLGPLSDEHDEYVRNKHLHYLLPSILPLIEADVYHSLCLMLDQLLRHNRITIGGIYAEHMVARLAALMQLIDKPLVEHLRSEGMEFMLFAFRWLLCLFTREFALPNLVCLWDAMIVDGERGFGEFPVYLAAAYLRKVAEPMRAQSMAEMFPYLMHQQPSKTWSAYDVHLLVQLAKQLRTSHPHLAV